MSSPRDVYASLSGARRGSAASMSPRRGAASPPPASSSPAGMDPNSSSSSSQQQAPLGPESGESLESKARKGERGFEEIGALVSLPFFDMLDKAAARKLGRFFTRRVFDSGQLVTHMEPAQAASSSSASSAAAAVPATAVASEEPAFHVLVSGRVELSTVGPDGSVVALGQHTHPAYFGAHALVRQTSLQPVSVRALERSIILSIGAARFEEFIAQNPNVRVTLESHEPAAGSLQSAAGHAVQPLTSSSSFAFTNAAPGHSASASWGSFSSSPAPSPTAASAASASSSDKQRVSVSLRELPFFAQLGHTIPETKLQHLAALFEFRRCPEGQVLMREHEVATGFYILLSGRISVSALAASSHTPLHLSTLVAGDYFGEVSLIFRTLRTATLTAVQACTLLFLSNAHFATFLRLAPEVLHNGVFTSTLHKRVGASLKTVPLFACLRVKEKGPHVQYKEEVLNKLGELFVFHLYARGDIICREGDEAAFFGIIHRGSVEVCAKSLDSDRDDEQNGGSAPLDAEGNIILTELGQGDMLGEISLLSNTRRTATVRCVTDCVLLQLPRDKFQQFLQLVPEVKHTLERVMSMRTAHSLSQIPFFRTIRENKPWSKLSILGSMFKFEHHLAGSVVVSEGEVGNTFYVVCDGSVEVTKSVPNRHGQLETVVLDVLTRSCWFGEISLLRATVRLATVRCRTDCLFLSVTKDRFDKFIALAPDVADSFSSLVTHRTANMLRSLPFFARNITENKPWSKLELLCTLFCFEYFDRGVVIMRGGGEEKDTDKMYVLSVGCVAASRKRKEGDPPSEPLPPASSSPPASPTPSPNASPRGGDTTAEMVGAALPPAVRSTPPGRLSPLPQRSETASSGPASSSSSGSALQPPSSSQPAASLTDDDPSMYRTILQRGSTFNDTALLASLPRSHTIVALEPCVCFTLTREKFAHFAGVAPEFMEALRKAFPHAAEVEAAARAKSRSAASSPAAGRAATSVSPPISRPASAASSSSGSAAAAFSSSAASPRTSLAVPGASHASSLSQPSSLLSAASPAPASSASPRPAHHSSSFSSPSLVSAASGAGASLDAAGHSVMIDAMSVHARDGTVRHSRQNSPDAGTDAAQLAAISGRVSDLHVQGE